MGGRHEAGAEKTDCSHLFYIILRDPERNTFLISAVLGYGNIIGIV